jgi:hypothetical protein
LAPVNLMRHLSFLYFVIASKRSNLILKPDDLGFKPFRVEQ